MREFGHEGTKNFLVDFIWDLVKDNEYISEIETNAPGILFYKERGQRKSIEIPLKTEEEYHDAVDGIIEKAGLHKKPFLVEGRYTFKDGRFGRLHIIMPPAAPFAAITMAIKSSTLRDLTSIQAAGSFNTEISLFLKAAIGSKLTTVISGGTGAGKTTMIEAMTGEFDLDARVGVAEDAPELLLPGQNVVYLNSTVRAPGVDEKDIATLEWVVQQINRMRVDLIIVGETRGKEFYDYIIGANSGKPGSLTTIHADDGPAAVRKMATFINIAVNMPPRAIAEMISEAIDIVIQLGLDNKTKQHRVISIDEVTNTISSGEYPTIALNPLFSYNQETGQWERKFATDHLKKKLQLAGYDPNTYRKMAEEDEFTAGGGLPSYLKRED